MKRRLLLLGIPGVALAGGAGWLALAPPVSVARFADRGAVDAELDRLLAVASSVSTIGWPLAQTLAHCAQSIESLSWAK